MLATFMVGLASGRLISLAIEGMPNTLLLLYLFLELLIGALALVALRRGMNRQKTGQRI